MDNTDNTLLLILNPEAGLRYARKFLPEIIALFTDYGYQCLVFVTEKRGDAPYSSFAFVVNRRSVSSRLSSVQSAQRYFPCGSILIPSVWTKLLHSANIRAVPPHS